MENTRSWTHNDPEDETEETVSYAGEEAGSAGGLPGTRTFPGGLSSEDVEQEVINQAREEEDAGMDPGA